jgi:hypothetical protein
LDVLDDEPLAEPVTVIVVVETEFDAGHELME